MQVNAIEGFKEGHATSASLHRDNCLRRSRCRKDSKFVSVDSGDKNFELGPECCKRAFAEQAPKRHFFKSGSSGPAARLDLDKPEEDDKEAVCVGQSCVRVSSFYQGVRSWHQ